MARPAWAWLTQDVHQIVSKPTVFSLYIFHMFQLMPIKHVCNLSMTDFGLWKYNLSSPDEGCQKIQKLFFHDELTPWLESLIAPPQKKTNKQTKNPCFSVFQVEKKIGYWTQDFFIIENRLSTLWVLKWKQKLYFNCFQSWEALHLRVL